MSATLCASCASPTPLSRRRYRNGPGMPRRHPHPPSPVPQHGIGHGGHRGYRSYSHGISHPPCDPLPHPGPFRGRYHRSHPIIHHTGRGRSHGHARGRRTRGPSGPPGDLVPLYYGEPGRTPGRSQPSIIQGGHIGTTDQTSPADHTSPPIRGHAGIASHLDGALRTRSPVDPTWGQSVTRKNRQPGATPRGGRPPSRLPGAMATTLAPVPARSPGLLGRRAVRMWGHRPRRSGAASA